MKELPDSFWAAIFIVLACFLAVVAMFAPRESTAVITMASSIITGAFGYIQGKKAGTDSVNIPLSSTPSTPTTTTVSVGPSVDPPQPVAPAQPKAGQ